MERLHKTMNVYIKSLSKRSEGDDKEKSTPIAQLGSTAISHADDFEPDSEFGQCLSSKKSTCSPPRDGPDIDRLRSRERAHC